MKYYQQGDVLLIPTKKIEGKKINSKTVQHGEHTGHAHRFVSNDASNASLFQHEERKFVLIQGGQATLTHEEHLPITIEEGEYEVRIVREKDLFSKLVRTVVD
jgi:hypothetical protein